MKKTKKNAAQAARIGLKEAWQRAKQALGAAEVRTAKRVKALIESNRGSVEEAAAALARFGAELAKQRERRLGEIQAQLETFSERLGKERRRVAKLARQKAQGALAGLDIPSRREVTELTRKVEELGRKIDSLRKAKTQRA
jgi:hypothetical protein